MKIEQNGNQLITTEQVLMKVYSDLQEVVLTCLKIFADSQKKEAALSKEHDLKKGKQKQLQKQSTPEKLLFTQHVHRSIRGFILS